MILNWLLGNLWWLLAIPAGIALLIVGNLVGWDRVRVFILPAVGVLAAIGLLGRARQQGYQARKAEEDKALAKAEKTVEQKRREAEGLSDKELDHEVDKWSKR